MTHKESTRATLRETEHRLHSFPVPDWYYLPIRFLEKRGFIKKRTRQFLANIYAFRSLKYARRRLKGHSLSTYRVILIDRYGERCMRPGCKSTEKITVDHIVPRSRGGKDSFKNLQLLCYKHNQEKGNREEHEIKS